MSVVKMGSTSVKDVVTTEDSFTFQNIDISENMCQLQANIKSKTGNISIKKSEKASLEATTLTKGNISITSIKCDVDRTDLDFNIPVPYVASTEVASYNTTDIRSSVTKEEDSDSETELTNIENFKVTHRIPSTTGFNLNTQNKNGPRPMSWEGELSDTETTETEIMETESSLNYEPTGIMSEDFTSLKSGSQTTFKYVSFLQSMKSDLDQATTDKNITLYSPHLKLKLGPAQSDPINLKCEAEQFSKNSPLLVRNKSANLPVPTNPSPDSAIHSIYTQSSPSESPLTSRHAQYTPSLSRNNSDASHSSCYSYSSEFSPTHSPIQNRHALSSQALYGNVNSGSLHSVLYRPHSVENNSGNVIHPNMTSTEASGVSMETATSTININTESLPSAAAGISRQQLINSPCPICGDKISGFHYGIFSCESCKGFFKRTVQNRKNYVCVRGGPCLVSITTRKKCPACRFEKCLQKGMKLEAIREDRTRGGRSTYQCSYILPNPLLSPHLTTDHQTALPVSTGHHQIQCFPSQKTHHGSSTPQGFNRLAISGVSSLKSNHLDDNHSEHEKPLNDDNSTATCRRRTTQKNVPVLLQEIMDVEHLWQYNEAELERLNQPPSLTKNSTTSTDDVKNPLLARAGLSSTGENANPDLIAHLCNVADHRLYKIVKWCKSLPLFKNISIDDQICLLINSWCELLLFSCCFRSVDTPGEVKMSQGKTINLAQAKTNGLQSCIERMLNLTEHLRRLNVDQYEYVAMKVIVLLQSDTSELQEPVKVRECQERALQSLQLYTLDHYPDMPSKFGELLLRIPDLQRACQLGKEMLTIKSRDGGDFNLLMELLRGEH